MGDFFYEPTGLMKERYDFYMMIVQKQNQLFKVPMMDLYAEIILDITISNFLVRVNCVTHDLVLAPYYISGNKRLPENVRNGGIVDSTEIPHPKTVMVWDLLDVTTYDITPLLHQCLEFWVYFYPFSSTVNKSLYLSPSSCLSMIVFRFSKHLLYTLWSCGLCSQFRKLWCLTA